MKKLLIVAIITFSLVFIILFAVGCSFTRTVLYEGVLKGISTTKGTTTIIFINNTIVTDKYYKNYSDGDLIFGEVYDLMQAQGCGENIIYLQKVKEIK